eukprot:6090656-Pleurochrysis_carterae.AAC.1
MPYLLARKSDTFDAIKHFLAFCSSYHIAVRRMHTENAGDLTSRQFREHRMQKSIRLSTISPHVPRQNGACERKWQTMVGDVRAKLATSKLPVSCWWYHLKSSTDVASRLSTRANRPKESAWFRFTGQ